MQIKLYGPSINSQYFTLPYQQKKNTLGNKENLDFQLRDIVNNNTTTKREESEDIQASFHNLTRTIDSVGFGSFNATIGNNTSGVHLIPYFASLSGDPLAFPLDYYSVDLIIKIPFKHVKIMPHLNETKTGELSKSTWKPLDPKIVPCGT
jgi:hypothetical protein